LTFLKEVIKYNRQLRIPRFYESLYKEVKMIKHQLIRAALKVLTLPLPVFLPGETPIFSERFSIFSRLPEDTTLRAGLVKAYQTVFGEPPWKEEWPEEKILIKLQRELTGHSFLVLMQGDEKFPVGGFSWGAVVPVGTLETRIGQALLKQPTGLTKILQNRGMDEVLYFDEFAILRPFRRGLEPIRFLLRPGLELGLGYQNRMHQALFWSIPNSKIVPIALYVGFEPVFQFEAEGKEIIFLLNPNFLPLLKIAQSVKGKRIAQLMKVISRFLWQEAKS
jgi:hypothetical protein